MFGLGAIDFSSLCGLAGDLSRSDLFNTFRSGLPDGFVYKVSDGEINEILNSVLGKYRVTSDSVDIDPSIKSAIENDVKSAIESVLGRVSGRFAAYSLNILGIVNTLKSQGVAVAPKQSAAPAPASANIPWTPMPQPSPVMSPPSVSMQQTAPQGAAPMSYQASRRRAPVHGKGLLQDKSKLYWVMGIGGAVLVVAIALIASKSE